MYKGIYNWFQLNFGELFIITIVILVSLIIVSSFVRERKKVTLIWWLALISYMIILFIVTIGFREVENTVKIDLNVRYEIRETLKRITEGYASDNTMNVLLFLPFGFVMGNIWNYKWNFIVCVGTGAIISWLIEYVQLVTKRGFCDINDIINNVCGVVLGYTLYLLCVIVKKLISRLRIIL